MVREVATWPLTQDLLSHEVRGSGGHPQTQLPSPPCLPPAHSPPSRSGARGLGRLWRSGWRVREGDLVCLPLPQPSTEGALRLSPCVLLSRLQDCYILDQGGLKVYVWKGKNANAQQKREAMSQALVGLGVREENLEEKAEKPTPAGRGQRGQGQAQPQAEAREGSEPDLAPGGVGICSAAILAGLCTLHSQPPGNLGVSAECGLPPPAWLGQGMEKWRLAFLQMGVGSAWG